MATGWATLLALAAAVRGGEDGLLAYWPFEETAGIALGSAPGWTVPAASGLAYGEGVAGKAVRLVTDCRFGMGEAFPVQEGSFAAWVRWERPGPSEEPRYVFCVYGADDLEPAWGRNRWSLVSYGNRLSFQVYGDAGGRALVAEAGEGRCQDGGWHHVAVTWRGLDGRGEAELRLYLDGQQAAAAKAAGVEVKRTSGRFDLGRDSDGSPDYGQMLLDDAFLYGRALRAEEIAAGVAATTPGRARPVAGGAEAPAEAPGWEAGGGLAHRVEMVAAAARKARRDWSLYCRPGLEERLRGLGLAGTPDVSRARLFAETEGGQWQERAWRREGETLSWPVPGDWPAGEARRFRLYFDVRSYAERAPLVVAAPRGEEGGEAGRAGIALPEYAQEAYGDAWDFEEGDLEEIDGFGNRPELIREVRVAEGALHAKVSQDGYIIWGSLWGAEDRGKRRVRLDVARYPVLELRVRQSVPAAAWKIYGRPLGSERLLAHEFSVSGSGWQTVRVDLAKEAGWSGVLSAFRLNLTLDVEAEVAVDFVRLIRATEAQAGPVETPGQPSGKAARLVLLPETEAPEAGTEQTVRVRVEDAGGKPVAGQPVRVELSGGSGAGWQRGAAASVAAGVRGRRALSNGAGEADFRLAAGRRAGTALRIEAEAEFGGGVRAALELPVRGGKPSAYAVGEPGVTILPEERMPLRLRIVATDACGNEVSWPGRRIEWRSEEARTAGGQAVTAENGVEVSWEPDLARRWVYRVRVKDDEGLEGESGEICVLPKGRAENKVVLREGAFRTQGGQPFVPLGGFYAVWIPRIPGPGEEEGRNIRAFTEASEEEMRHWFGFLRGQGVTALRMMLRTHGPGGTEAMDAGGRVNRVLFAKVLRLMEVAHREGLRFMLTLHDDYDKPVYVNDKHLQAFALPAFAGEDLERLAPFQRRFLVERDLVSPHDRYLDADAIACQDQYAREIVGYLKDNPALFSWELENEMVDCPAGWVNHAVEVIREVDPVTPVCVSHGGGGLVTADPLFWTRTRVDFYTYHLYPLGTTSQEADYGLVTDVLTRYGRMAGTCFLGECAGDEFSRFPAERDGERRWIMRDLVWFSLINRNPGCFFWNARGWETGEFRLAGEVWKEADWLLAEKAPAGVAVRVDHPLERDGWYRTERGRKDLAVMERYARHFLERGVEFDFVAGAEGAAGGGPGPLVCGLGEFAPPEVTGRFTPSPGYQVAGTTRADGRAGLLYVRCAAGIQPWSPEEGRALWLRKRAPVLLRLRCGEGEGWEAKVLDLDSGERRVLKPGSDGSLDLGKTEHDFAVLWQRR